MHPLWCTAGEEWVCFEAVLGRGDEGEIDVWEAGGIHCYTLQHFCVCLCEIDDFGMEWI